jgi:hypothetical protein
MIVSGFLNSANYVFNCFVARIGLILDLVILIHINMSQIFILDRPMLWRNEINAPNLVDLPIRTNFIKSTVGSV